MGNNLFRLDSLFGSLVYRQKIDPKLYQKDKIIQAINSNYRKNPHRNKWGTSNMHHMYDDKDNRDFKLPDFTSLVPVYEDVVESFLDTTGVVDYKYSVEIVNYTVINKDQEMPVHSHLEHTSFACVHYISYDPESHYPLVFHNDSPNVKWLRSTSLCKNVSNQSIYHSMFFDKWSLNIEEDMLLIFPAYLEHSVENFWNISKAPEKNRICIVSSILIH